MVEEARALPPDAAADSHHDMKLGTKTLTID
jgi:hypothetical protein